MTFTLTAPETDEPMTPEQLQATARRLGMLSRENLREAYRCAWDECRLQAGSVPRAGALQELIIAWKLLRAWYERTDVGP